MREMSGWSTVNEIEFGPNRREREREKWRDIFGKMFLNCVFIFFFFLNQSKAEGGNKGESANKVGLNGIFTYLSYFLSRIYPFHFL